MSSVGAKPTSHAIRKLSRAIYDVSDRDMVTCGMVSVLLTGVGLVASIIPRVPCDQSSSDDNLA